MLLLYLIISISIIDIISNKVNISNINM